MDFKDKLNTLSTKVSNLKDTIETEEATKNAFIMPFLSTILGYDVFNPEEVVPEYTADRGVKKGEKVDYAIFSDGELQILMECKPCHTELVDKHQAQLSRYFHVTKARIAILTNGINYQFFTDIDKPNVMDSKPFLEIDIEDIEENLMPELMKLTKKDFDIESVISTAGDLKYLNQINKILNSLFQEPSEEFIKMITSQVYDGVKTAKVVEQFTSLTKRAMAQFLKDKVNDRITSALEKDTEVIEYTAEEEIAEENKIVTTEEELEGFHVVKSILRKVIPVDRIVSRDTQSYFGVLLDDNNRKPLCRLHFNAKQKYIGIIDAEKKEVRHPISSVDDIYDFEKHLVATAKNYE